MNEEMWGIVAKLLGISYVLFERWLGRTHVVKANSTLDLLTDASFSILSLFRVRQEKLITQKEGEVKICNSKKLKN